MKKTIKFICVLFIIIILTGCTTTEQKQDDKFKIVTSFYPMYIIALNLTENVEDVTVENMADTNIGCLHDYTLTTNDLIKLEDADVFIQNGLGIETFIEKITESYEDLKIINSSDNIENLIVNGEIVNGHIWTSVENYILQIQNISEELCKVNPKNENKYKRNAKKYIDKINEANEQVENAEIQAVCFDESFEYLANENNIKLTTAYTDHEESSLSAETLANLIDKVKAENIQVIIVAKNEENKNATLLQKETGAKIYELDNYITGDNDKNSYINSLKQNKETIKQLKETR